MHGGTVIGVNLRVPIRYARTWLFSDMDHVHILLQLIPVGVVLSRE